MDAQEKVRQYYDHMANVYDEKYTPPNEEINIIKMIVNDIPGNVLDVGTGTGRILFQLESLGCTGKGIDISKKMIDVANRKSRSLGSDRGISFEVCDLLNMDIESKYDIITAIGIFEYIDDFNPHFEKINALLDADGLVIFSVLNKFGIYALRYYCISKILHILNHCKYIDRYNLKLESPYPLAWYSLKEIKNILKSKGFKIEYIIPMRRLNILPIPAKFSHKLFLIKARKI